MKVKNLLIFAVAIFFSGSLMAQTFGIRAGINSANQNIKYDEDPIENTFDNKFILKFHAGVIADLPIVDDLSIETGLIYYGTGTKIDESFMGNAIKNQTNINFIQLPISLKYRANMGAASIFVHAGPYTAFALTGNFTSEVAGEEITQDVKFGDGDLHTNRLDYGMNIGAGVGFGPLDLGINYGFGIANLGNMDDRTITNRILSLSLTYRFVGSN